MWVNKAEYFRIVKERDEAAGVAKALEQRVFALETSADWLRVQFSKCDHERAALIAKYLGVQVPTMVFEQEDKSRTPTSHIINDAGALFADVGDEEALKQGLGWDDDGNFVAKKQPEAVA